MNMNGRSLASQKSRICESLMQAEIESLLPFDKKFVNSRWRFDHQTFVTNQVALIKDRAAFLSNSDIERHYLRIASKSGYRAANLEMLALVDRLAVSDLRLWWTDGQIKDFCESKAAICRRLEIQSPMPAWEIRELIHEYGFEFPDFDIFGLESAVNRVSDPAWWRRQVRRLQARECDEISRNMRLVHSDRDIYCSKVAKQVRADQRRRNREMLESMVAINDEGQAMLLSDLADKSVSNPAIRRVELMVRMRGFEEVAIKLGHIGMFVTVTAPSKYHPMTRVYNKRKGKKIAVVNRKYNGATVRDAQNFHCKQFAKLRSYLDRNQADIYGFRVAEPHHDGTPHWHFMIFARPSQVGFVKSAFNRYWLQVDGNEAGAVENRIKFVDMDPASGTATGYIAKYISKNIDGYGLESDLYGRDASESALAIDAWASSHGIRQFQQIGGPSVTVWRELRAIRSDESIECKQFRDVWSAADSSDWAAFVLLMGGPMAKRDEQPVRAVRDVLITSIDEVYSRPQNKYGDPMSPGVVGLKLVKTGFTLITKVHQWVVKRIDEVSESVRAGISSLANGPPGRFALDLCQ